MSEHLHRNSFRIIKATQPISGYIGGYDHTHSYLYGYELDLRRKTAALIRQSRRGEGDTLLLYGVDRLERDKQSATDLQQQLEAMGVTLVVPTDSEAKGDSNVE